MIKNYYVFDDIISIEEQKILNDYIKSSNIEWVSMENITGEYGGKSKTHKFQENTKLDDVKEYLERAMTEKNINEIILEIPLKMLPKDRKFLEHVVLLGYKSRTS